MALRRLGIWRLLDFTTLGMGVMVVGGFLAAGRMETRTLELRKQTWLIQGYLQPYPRVEVQRVK